MVSRRLMVGKGNAVDFRIRANVYDILFQTIVEQFLQIFLN